MQQRKEEDFISQKPKGRHQKKAQLEITCFSKEVTFELLKIMTFILASCWKIHFYRLLLLFHFLSPSPPPLVSPLLLLLPPQLLLRLPLLLLVPLLAVRLPTQQPLLLLKKKSRTEFLFYKELILPCNVFSLVMKCAVTRYFMFSPINNVFCFFFYLTKIFWKWTKRCDKVPLIKTVKLFIGENIN